MSKPKLYDAPIKVRLPEDDLERLTRLSRKYDVPVAELIRACVKRATPYVEELLEKLSKKKD
jgi:Ribbon-helix-helix protein, copG family